MSDKLLVFTVLGVAVGILWGLRYVVTGRGLKRDGLLVLLPTLAAWWLIPEGFWLKLAALGVAVGVAVTTYGWVYIGEAFGIRTKVKAGAR